MPNKLAILLFLQLFSAQAMGNDTQIPPLHSLYQDAILSTQSQRPILLVFSETLCIYCHRVKKNFIKPMMISGDYDDQVIFRQATLDNRKKTITGLNGKTQTLGQLAKQYRIKIIPTVLFLDASGRELSERIIGINSEDYYGYFLDQAILQALKKINPETHRD
jgi:thioredoxin-related protein